MSKMKQYIGLMTPMEAYQKGYDKGQEDVCTVSVSEIFEKGYKQGVKEVVEALPKGLFIGDLPPEEGKPYSHLGCYILKWGKEDEPTMGLSRLDDNEEWQAQLKKWGY